MTSSQSIPPCMPAGRPRSVLIAAAFAATAAGIPFFAAWLQQRMLGMEYDSVALQPVPPLSLGEGIGLLMGVLAGARSRRLAVWVLGPPTGFIVGFLDVRIQYLLGCQDWLTPNGVSLVPVWGALMGFALAVVNRQFRPALFVLATAPVMDWLGRVSGEWLLHHLDLSGDHFREGAWLAGAACFAPACVVLALAVPKTWRGDAAGSEAAPTRFRDWLIPAAATAILVMVMNGRTGAPCGVAAETKASCSYENLGIPGRAQGEFTQSIRELFRSKCALAGWQPLDQSDLPWPPKYFPGDYWRQGDTTIGLACGPRRPDEENLVAGMPLSSELDPRALHVLRDAHRCFDILVLHISDIHFDSKELQPSGSSGWEELFARIPDRARRLAARASLTHRFDCLRMPWIENRVDAFLIRAGEVKK